MPSPTPQPPPCKGTSFWKRAFILAAFILMVIACLAFIRKTETFRDLIVFSTLGFKYGASVLMFLHWIACGCVQFVAYIVSISSWKVTMILAMSVGFLCYMVYIFCLQCIAIVRQTVRMLLDMFEQSIRALGDAFVGLLIVVCCVYWVSTVCTKYWPHIQAFAPKAEPLLS